jgi:hypothetical protein
VKKFEKEQYVLFEQAEIEEYIAEFLGIGQRDSRSVLRAMEAQHGLLIERAHKVWSFSHLTFQEYLVAKWFCDRGNWQSLVSHVTENYWEEVFYLVAGMLNKADELMQCIKFQAAQLIATNDQIQEYLTWVSDKADHVKNNGDFIALIRAFYLSFSRDRVFLFTHGYTESLNLGLALCLDRNFDYRLNDELYFDATILRTNEINLALLKERAQNLNQDFKSQLQLLIDKFTQFPTDSAEFQQWWQQNGKIWTEEFWLTMTKYRRIRQRWNFNEREKQLLNQYDYANKLLVNCLHSNCDITYKTRQEIQKTLLLPIAEIEKRKQEKAE